MTHRSDRVHLPADYWRCEPSSRPCAEKGHCARYMAEIPQGGSLADGTLTRPCLSYVNIGKWPEAERETRRTHPPMGAK